MNYDIIKPYIEKGLVSEQAHPENEAVRIFNYTQECQFSKGWDDVTRQCRGLIMNVDTGEVIARPFPKFFNYQEHIANGWPVPAETPIVSEKLDGSLGILYHLNGKAWIATRGSFKSDQALWATDWWRKNMGTTVEDGFTHLFEIIYPENRIVVSYDFSGLVHLASLDTQTSRPSSITLYDMTGKPVRAAKQIATTSLEALAEMDEPNSEGFVCYFPTANTRMKIKFPEYVRLHKIMTGLSEIGIWEGLANGNKVDLADVPDEMFNWIKSVEGRLQAQVDAIESDAYAAVKEAEELPTRKEQAEVITKGTKYPGVAFAMLDKKDWEAIAWKMVRPKGGKTFKVDIDL